MTPGRGAATAVPRPSASLPHSVRWQWRKISGETPGPPDPDDPPPNQTYGGPIRKT